MTQSQKSTMVEEPLGGRGASDPTPPSPGQLLKASLRGLLSAAVDRVAGFAMDKVDDVAGSLENVAAEGGPKIGAILGGVQAKLSGGNLVWGAAKGAFGALSPGAKVGILLLLVLALVLLPVTVVLVLLALIVLVIVLIVSSRSTG